MSSEKFEDLEDELKVLHEDISTKITIKIPKLTGGKFAFQLLTQAYKLSSIHLRISLQLNINFRQFFLFQKLEKTQFVKLKKR